MWLPAKWLNQQHSPWQGNGGSDEGRGQPISSQQLRTGMPQLLDEREKLWADRRWQNHMWWSQSRRHTPLLLNMMDVDLSLDANVTFGISIFNIWLKDWIQTPSTVLILSAPPQVKSLVAFLWLMCLDKLEYKLKCDCQLPKHPPCRNICSSRRRHWGRYLHPDLLITCCNWQTSILKNILQQTVR